MSDLHAEAIADYKRTGNSYYEGKADGIDLAEQKVSAVIDRILAWIDNEIAITERQQETYRQARDYDRRNDCRAAISSWKKTRRKINEEVERG